MKPQDMLARELRARGIVINRADRVTIGPRGERIPSIEVSGPRVAVNLAYEVGNWYGGPEADAFGLRVDNGKPIAVSVAAGRGWACRVADFVAEQVEVRTQGES